MSHSGATEAIDRILDAGGEADEVLQAVVDVLHDRFDHYSWIGIYLVEGDELVLGPWKGPQATEHVRIPVGQGICGAAAATGQTEVVDDVNADERYLACFPSTSSEIVVPIAYDGQRRRRDRHRLRPAGRFRPGRPCLPRAGCAPDLAGMLRSGVD